MLNSCFHHISGGKGYDPEGGADDYSAFSEWLQCYYQTGMRNMVDHNKRTIWFKGEAGPMVPKGKWMLNQCQLE